MNGYNVAMDIRVETWIPRRDNGKGIQGAAPICSVTNAVQQALDQKGGR